MAVVQHIVQIKAEDSLGRIVLWCKACRIPLDRSFEFSVKRAVQVANLHNEKETRKANENG